MPQLLHYLEVEKNTELVKTLVTPEANSENNATDGKEQEPAASVNVKGIVKNAFQDVSLKFSFIFFCFEKKFEQTNCGIVTCRTWIGELSISTLALRIVMVAKNNMLKKLYFCRNCLILSNNCLQSSDRLEKKTNIVFL